MSVDALVNWPLACLLIAVTAAIGVIIGPGRWQRQNIENNLYAERQRREMGPAPRDAGRLPAPVDRTLLDEE